MKGGRQYDIWLHWHLLERCNLSCAYCFRRQRLVNFFSFGALEFFPHLLSFLRKKLSPFTSNQHVDVERLVKNLDATGKTCLVGLNGGEPFLHPDFIPLCRGLTKNHYILITSNLVAADLSGFAAAIDPARVAEIVASLQIKELERLGLTDRYIDNFTMLRNKGFPVMATVVAYPPLAAEIAGYRSAFAKRGIEFKCMPFIGVWQGKVYPENYRRSELLSFGLEETVTKNYLRRGEKCNAGYNACVIASDGTASPCHMLPEKLGNIHQGICFKKKVITCPVRHCFCPLKEFDPFLFEKAVL